MCGIHKKLGFQGFGTRLGARHCKVQKPLDLGPTKILKTLMLYFLLTGTALQRVFRVYEKYFFHKKYKDSCIKPITGKPLEKRAPGVTFGIQNR